MVKRILEITSKESSCENDLKNQVIKENLKKLKDSPMMNETFQVQDYIKNMNVTEARINLEM